MSILLKNIIKSTPVLGGLAASLNQAIKNKKLAETAKNFKSQDYWEGRYRENGNSGAGSYHHFAEFKAEIINTFVSEKNIISVLELGCGDGNQLKLAKYRKYIGFDVSKKSITLCKELFKNDASKEFRLMDKYENEKSQLTLSLDVIYHLVEDEVFNKYMKILFSASEKFVIIYASNTDDQSLTSAIHVRHRKFTTWIESNCPEWHLLKYLPNKYPYNGDTTKTSFADFYIFERGDK